MNDPHEMMAAYLEGELDESQVAELELWLRADRRRARAFVRYAMLHCQLGEELRDENLNAFASGEMDGSGFGGMLAALDDTKGEAAQPVDISDVMRRREMEAKAKQAESHASFNRRFGLAVQQDEGSKTRHYVIPRPLFYGGIAAVIAVAAAIFWPMIQSPEPLALRPVASVEERSIVATLSVSVDASWANGLTYTSNAKIRQGDYELTEGLAKVIYANGAEAIIEAPAHFSLESDNRLRLHEGKLVGHCPTPQSKGFAVIAPNARIVDLGTEFGVAVNERGETLTQVFTGEIEVAGLTNGKVATAPNLVRAGEAKVIDSTGSRVDDVESQPLAFVRGDELAVKVRARAGSAIDRWREYTYGIRRRSSLIAYYDFEDIMEVHGRIRNLAPGMSGRMDAAMEMKGAFRRKANGRFGSNGAIDFRNRHDDRLIIEDWKSSRPNHELTIATWVRPRDFEPGWDIIFSQWCEGVPAEEGGAFLHVGVTNIDPAYPGHSIALQWSGSGFEFEDVFQDEDRRVGTLHAGRWVHVVAVFETVGRVRLHVDGKLVALRTDIEFPNGSFPPVTRPLVLGGKDGLNYYLDGVMDDFMIFDEALSAVDIAEMYEAGRSH